MYELLPPSPQKPSRWGGVVFIILICLFVFIIYNLFPRWYLLRPSYSPGVSFSSVHQVTYKVSGTGDLSITYENDGSDTAQVKKYQTWDYSFSAQSDQFIYVSAQNMERYGSVQCDILIDGVAIKHTESTGGFVIASCSTSAH